jgi:hypothetical protein
LNKINNIPFEVAVKRVMAAFDVSRSIAEANLRSNGIYTLDKAEVFISALKNEGRSLPQKGRELTDFAKLVQRLIQESKRPMAAVLSAVKQYGVTAQSPDALINDVISKLTRATWTRNSLAQEIGRRAGYQVSTVMNYMNRYKLNIHDPEKIEEFVVFLKNKHATDGRVKGQFKSKKPKITELSGGRGVVVEGATKDLRKPVVNTRNLIWQPDALPGELETHKKQYEFLNSIEDIVGMEGGKGSGKTDLLIFDCIRPSKLGHPLWHGVIFRREYKRLVEVVDRARYWFSRLPQLQAHWQGSESRFVFPSGAWLAFHNVEHIGDEQKYQGWQIADLKFDQLEEFEEGQFDYLLLQNRNGDPTALRNTVRFTANPMGTGHKWVKRRFIDNKNDLERHIIEVEIEGIKYQRTFKRIHATVFDNPLLARDEKYIATLATDPNPIRRKAMFRGDWDVVLGQFFDSFTTEVHVIKPWDLPSGWNRTAGIDYGREKIMEFLARDYEGNVYVEWEFCLEPDTMKKPNGFTADEFGEMSAQFMLDRGIGEGLSVIGDTNMWSATGRDVGSDKVPALSIQAIWNNAFKKAGKHPPVLMPVSKRGTEEYRYRVACNEAVRSFLRYEITPEGEITRQPRMFFMRTRCERLIETMPSLVADESNPMDLADGQYDHPYDALKMPFMQVYVPKSPAKEQTAEDKWNAQREMTLSHQDKRLYDWRIAGW